MLAVRLDGAFDPHRANNPHYNRASSQFLNIGRGRFYGRRRYLLRPASISWHERIDKQSYNFIE